MPANSYPTFPGGYDIGVIHVKLVNGHTSTRRQTNNLTPIMAPGKMIAPGLLFRVKKRNNCVLAI